MKKYLILLLTTVLLTACDKPDDITRVKSLVYEKLDNAHTVGDVLSNREVCQNVTWKSYTDENNQRLVEYVCDLKLDKPNAYLNEVVKKRVDELSLIKREKDSTDDWMINQMINNLQVSTKIGWYRQRIIWSVSPDNNLIMTGCSLVIRRLGDIELFDTISDESMSDTCFKAAYQNEYVDEVYNEQIYNHIDIVESEI